MEIHGWRLDVGKRKVKIYDDDDKITDDEALSIITYLYDEGLLSSMQIECVIITK